MRYPYHFIDAMTVCGFNGFDICRFCTYMHCHFNHCSLKKCATANACYDIEIKSYNIHQNSEGTSYWWGLCGFNYTLTYMDTVYIEKIIYG